MCSDGSGTSLVIHLFFSHLCSWYIALPFVPSLPTCVSFTVFKYCMLDIQNAPNAINHNSSCRYWVYLPPRDEFLTWVSKSLVSWYCIILFWRSGSVKNGALLPSFWSVSDQPVAQLQVFLLLFSHLSPLYFACGFQPFADQVEIVSLIWQFCSFKYRFNAEHLPVTAVVYFN